MGSKLILSLSGTSPAFAVAGLLLLAGCGEADGTDRFCQTYGPQKIEMVLEIGSERARMTATPRNGKTETVFDDAYTIDDDALIVGNGGSKRIEIVDDDTVAVGERGSWTQIGLHRCGTEGDAA